MTINDPIADMLTRIRNAGMARRAETSMPSSKILVAIAEILKREGYILDYRVEERQPYPILTIELKYGPDRRHAIRTIKRISKPGLRVYSSKERLPRVQSGLGIAVVSTPQGVLSDREARRRGVGGEVLCTVW
ncbi:30S ribosomal protein S8 [Nitrolancea hollandica]|uniref:Small ribosomal subunit protein uS8 n=1 Tax=Nitrolancea hollandica Lb TaxID=1129897 RepID=I4EC58_9BACT|nr:30S ribosomal protein S8 [Nitrolancea hollandica]CCF82270.1 30S ribosomal subunit protein S8, and regulator [Nitrolancea hollandica Lb]